MIPLKLTMIPGLGHSEVTIIYPDIYIYTHIYIYTYIYIHIYIYTHILGVNVGKYSIHGFSGCIYIAVEQHWFRIKSPAGEEPMVNHTHSRLTRCQPVAQMAIFSMGFPWQSLENPPEANWVNDADRKMDRFHHTLWWCQQLAIENGPVEIVDFPIKKMVIFQFAM